MGGPEQMPFRAPTPLLPPRWSMPEALDDSTEEKDNEKYR